MYSRSGCALGALLVIAAGSSAVSARPEDAPSTRPAVRVEVLLTVAPGLAEQARSSMMTEAAAIWRANGVIIDWLPATAVRPVSHQRLRALVVERPQRDSNPDGPFTIGELVRPSNGHPMALMSIDSARRLMDSIRGWAGYDLAGMDPRRLGLVLGRALAHEIGHYLLETPTHASYGLMRPEFDALELADFREGVFALDRSASDWLKSHLGPMTASAESTEPTRFAYAP